MTKKVDDELRMPADEFDRIMRGALEAKPVPKEEEDPTKEGKRPHVKTPPK